MAHPAPAVSVEIFVPGVFGSITTHPDAPCSPGPFTRCDVGPIAPGSSVRVELRFTAIGPPRSTIVSEWIIREIDETCGCFGSFDPNRANNISRIEIRIVGRPH
jgi:hypothetical protein